MKEMNNRTRSGLVCCAAAALVLSMFTVSGKAQDAPPAKPAETPPPAQLKVNAYDPPETVIDAYRIGVADVLEISVTTGVGKSPQLSADNLAVNEKGEIQIFDGTISAQCLTTGELAANLKTRYLQYKREPLNVVVNVKEYRSQLVAVIGAVKSPGRFELRRPIRLLELLALYANGPEERSDGRIEVVHTQSTACNNENQKAKELTMTSASYKWEDTRLGREEANPFVRPGDVISLADAPQVFVIGNVREPKSIPLKERITLTTAIAMAGGTLESTKSDQIRIERQKAGSVSKEIVVVNLGAIKNHQAEDIVLQPGDIVDVPASTGGKILRGLLGAIVPTLSQSTVRIIR
jgi:polysaccharide export outer membrane protein